MPQFEFTMYADDDDRFAPGAFARSIGKPLSINESGTTRQAVLLAAVVDENGLAARLTVEMEALANGTKRRGAAPKALAHGPQGRR